MYKNYLLILGCNGPKGFDDVHPGENSNLFLFSKYDASGKLINEFNGNKYLNQVNYDALERVLRITLQ